MEKIDSGFLELRNEIVNMAIKDWKIRCKKRCEKSAFTELIRFFKSEYCDMLLAESKMTGADLLDRLYEIEGAPERKK